VTTQIAAAPPAVQSPVHVLVQGLVDYAGLFPPASLSMHAAVANFAVYRASADAWMLGRCVVPVARLAEWARAVAGLSASAHHAWAGARLSALIGTDMRAEMAAIAAFNHEMPFGVVIDCVEARTSAVDDVTALSNGLPDGVQLFCEIPHTSDPLELIRAVHAAGASAKIRTGGVTPDAFPRPADIVRFLARCCEVGVVAKATAGLHHPLRGAYRLTYDLDAPTGTMFGYLNVLLAAAALRAGYTAAVAEAMLTTDRPDALHVTPDAITVDIDPAVGGPVELLAGTIAQMRATQVVSFGSCSFREPVDELRPLIARAAR
jgi:hypothetical protein